MAIMLVKALSFLLITGIVSVTAQTTLSGAVGNKTFSAAGNPHIVTGDLIIEKSTTTTLKAGTVFLFKPFTGIKVLGTLSVEGTSDKPVIFTSVQDSIFNPAAEQKPNPFDWNGIFIDHSAVNVRLSNFQLSYSVFGIKSRKETVQIDRGLFNQNGQFHFTINDAIQPVQDGFPYSYNTDGKIHDIVIIHRIKPRTFAMVTTGVAGIGCIAASVPFLLRAHDANTKGNETHLQYTIDDYRDRERHALRTSAAFAFPGLLSIVTSVALFIVENHEKDEDNKVSIIPISNVSGTGVAFVAEF